MAKNKVKTKKGFTIIEVVLVLAVGGLIMMMVFLALPALQRSQRDTQRRDQLAGLVTKITEYQANNRNRLPSTATAASNVEPDEETGEIEADKPTDWAKFYKNYLLAGNDLFEDPNGVPYKLAFATCTGDAASGNKCTGNDKAGITVQRADTTFDEQDYWVLVMYNATCDGEETVYDSGSRRVVVTYKLEGGGTFCQGN